MGLTQTSYIDFQKAFDKVPHKQRVINDWNSLPQTVVQTRNLNSFKSGIDIFLAKIIYDIKLKRNSIIEHTADTVYVQSTQNSQYVY